MQKFVITTQFLENYGAHCEDGKFSSGNAYWKMKGGTDYIVSGLDRIQDAVAYVAALCMANNIGWKEFPVEFLTYAEWDAQLNSYDADYQEFIRENAHYVDPTEMKEAA